MLKRSLFLSAVLLISMLFLSGCTENKGIETAAPSKEPATVAGTGGCWEAETQGEKYYLSLDEDGIIFTLTLDKTEGKTYFNDGVWTLNDGEGENTAYLLTDSSGYSSCAEIIGELLSLEGLLFYPSTLTEKDAMEAFVAYKTEDFPAYEILDTALNTGFVSDRAAVQASAIVKNIGDAPIAISDITFDLEGADGAFLASIGDFCTRCIPQVILPGEQGYIAVMDILDEGVTQEHLNSFSQAKVHFSCEENPNAVVTQYEVEDVSLSTYSVSCWGVKGRVVNDTKKTAREVQVVAALYDADGAFLGILQTNPLADIRPGDKLGFDDSDAAIPKSALPLEPETIVAYAYSVSTE